MRRTISAVLMVLILAGCTFSGNTGASPMVWIDRPLDGESFPPAPLILQAHAADVDGISMIEFLVSDSLLSSLPTGGARLEEASLEWLPPGPGVYKINVRAIDTLGNTNARSPASIQITIIENTQTFTATPIPLPVLTETPTPTTPSPDSVQCLPDNLVAPLLSSPVDGESVTGDPLLTWSYPDSSCHPFSYIVDISSDVSFADISLGFGTANYNEISRVWPLPAGACYYWRVKAYVPYVKGPPSAARKFCITSDITATPSPASFTLLKNSNCRKGPGMEYDSIDVLIKGDTVTIQGRNEANTWFWVQRSSGTGQCWIAANLGTATGPWQVAPVVDPPPLPITVTPALIDQTPPEISNLSAAPEIVSVQVQCGDTPSTVLIQARITDSGGVARAIARVSGLGEYDMSYVGDDTYQIILGPFSEAGTYSIIVQAYDNSGNLSHSAQIEVQAVTCPG